MERGVRKALTTLLMGHLDPLFLSPPRSGSGKGQRKDLTSKQSLEFSLIRTGLARKQDFILSSKYTLLGQDGSYYISPPPKNRTCEFPRIRLKWRRHFSSRLVSASLQPSLLLAYRLEPSFDRDCSSLLAALFRHPRSKSAPEKIS